MQREKDFLNCINNEFWRKEIGVQNKANTTNDNRRILLEIIYQQKSPFDQTKIEREFEERTGVSILGSGLHSVLQDLVEDKVLRYENYRYTVRLQQQGSL